MKKAFLLLVLLLSCYAYAAPDGAQITYNTTETKAPEPAAYINTSGGTFTTINLYGETQNLRWKAYAGNVSGRLTLDDGGNYTIYDWSLATVAGEVYTSRNDSIDWSDISCANQAMIYSEEAALNHTTTRADSINSTFKTTLHEEFYIGVSHIPASTCRSTATWVNDTAQAASEDALFQEMLLSDGSSLVYATILRDGEQGFNYKEYDFQMIVPEKDLPGEQSTKYYFWLELT